MLAACTSLALGSSRSLKHLLSRPASLAITNTAPRWNEAVPAVPYSSTQQSTFLLKRTAPQPPSAGVATALPRRRIPGRETALRPAPASSAAWRKQGLLRVSDRRVGKEGVRTGN